MSILSFLLTPPSVTAALDEIDDERPRIEYGQRYELTYPVNFEQVHSEPAPTDDPRFAWLIPFYGAETADIVKNYADDMQASGRGALVGLLAEGFDSINEIVVEFLPGVAPKVTRTYVWDTPQIDFNGDTVTIRRKRVRTYTSVEAPGFPQPFRVWIILKPLKIYTIPS